MTNYEYEILFLKAMDEKRIVCYENRSSKDHYHIHAYRRKGEKVIFFCLVETFFRAPDNSRWLEGSIRSFHEFSEILGATSETLAITEINFRIEDRYKTKLPSVAAVDAGWTTVD